MQRFLQKEKLDSKVLTIQEPQIQPFEENFTDYIVGFNVFKNYDDVASESNYDDESKQMQPKLLNWMETPYQDSD